MKRICIGIIACAWSICAIAQQVSLQINEKADAAAFPLGNAAVYYNAADAKVVGIAAHMFADDIKAITGKQVQTKTAATINDSYAVVAGTIDQSPAIQALAKAKLIDISPLKGKWEQFAIYVINKPYQSAKQLLVVAGSDRRGAAYGLMHLSRLAGVSPYTWWADIPPVKHAQLFVLGKYTSKSPSVQYRGIFLNDEDWGLQPWAAKNMDTAVKDIGPNTYRRIFELLLRLKANYIWPAMHPCTKAFYYYKENPQLADDYAIVVGGSHCEPMLRNNVFEWAENYEHEYGSKPGEWRYDVNQKQIYNYWDDRVKESKHFESVYTVGMRGVHDGSMPGPKDPNEKLKLLEKVVADQRTILQTELNKPAQQVPQIFVPYKEVLSLYQRGMQLPDDVTIIWPDDNHGYIRQLPNEVERKRSGGHGVYYHLSYWGRPQDFLWLSSISPSLISYEMSKAYAFNARKLWVVNVGDIKPQEAETQFFMDLAWDINAWVPDKAQGYTLQWAKETFGNENATAIAAIKNKYYALAANGKPEHLNKIPFSDIVWWNRITAYQAIAHDVLQLYQKIPLEQKDAFFQLMVYPVVSASLMNEKFGYMQMVNSSDMYMKRYADKANAAFDSIRLFTQQYNEKIAGGKWNGMMSWHPRDLEVFKMPTRSSLLDIERTDTVFALSVNAMEGKLTSGKGADLVKINGLGTNNGSIVSMPLDAVKKEGDAPTATYSVDLPAGKYVLQVNAVPVHAINKTMPLKMVITINNKEKAAFDFEVPAETAEWDKAVINGYVKREISFVSDGKTKTSVVLHFLSGNTVINELNFYRIK